MWFLSPSGWPVYADSADEQDELSGRGYDVITEDQVQAAIDAFHAAEASPPSTQLPGWALASDVAAALATKANASSLPGKLSISDIPNPATSGGTALRAAFVAASVRRREQRDRQARGGVIGIGNVGAVAFRFDDWDDLVNGTIHPLMRARGMPYGHAQISRPLGRPGMCTDAAVWTKVINACREGREVWNHSATHTWSSGSSITDEITTADAEIISNTGGAVRVQGWCWPGCGTVGGINTTTGGSDITDWSLYDTAAGRLVENTYSLSEAVIPDTQRRTFPTGVMHGQNTQTIGEGGVTLAVAKGYVDDCVAMKTGATFMLHAGNLIGIPGGQAGPYNMTLADFTALVDYVKAYQDAGTLEVLAPSGMYYADHSTNRLNLEPYGNFEGVATNDARWGRWDATVQTDGGHSGSNYLRTVAGHAGAYRQIAGIGDLYGVRGQAFRFEAWVRSNGTGASPGTGVPKVILQGDNGLGYMDLTAALAAVPTTTWTKIRVPFVLHPLQNVITYDVGVASGGDGIDFDDIQIVKV